MPRLKASLKLKYKKGRRLQEESQKALEAAEHRASELEKRVVEVQNDLTAQVQEAKNDTKQSTKTLNPPSQA